MNNCESSLDVRVDVQLGAADDTWLEWLPQETILFDGARLRRRTALDLAAGTQAMAGEILVFGRAASGEQVRHGLVHEAWQVDIDSAPVWADALHLDGAIGERLDDPACFGGARALATLILAGAGAGDHLALARKVTADHSNGAALRAGATLVNGVLLLRWLGSDPAQLRAAFGETWAALRAVFGGLAPRLPRLWQV